MHVIYFAFIKIEIMNKDTNYSDSESLKRSRDVKRLPHQVEIGQSFMDGKISMGSSDLVVFQYLISLYCVRRRSGKVPGA
jgi:hypothetical protein